MSEEPKKPPSDVADQLGAGTRERPILPRFFILILYAVLLIGYTVACALTVGFRFWGKWGFLAGFQLILAVVQGGTFILTREKALAYQAVAFLVVAAFLVWLGYINR